MLQYRMYFKYFDAIAALKVAKTQTIDFETFAYICHGVYIIGPCYVRPLEYPSSFPAYN